MGVDNSKALFFFFFCGHTGQKMDISKNGPSFFHLNIESYNEEKSCKFPNL